MLARLHVFSNLMISDFEKFCRPVEPDKKGGQLQSAFSGENGIFRSLDTVERGDSLLDLEIN